MSDGPSALPSGLPPRVPPGCPSALLDARAGALADLVVERPAEATYAALFTDGLRVALPPHRLTRLLQDLHHRLGRCVGVEVLSMRTPCAGVVEYLFEKGFRVEVSLTLEGDEPRRIAGFDLGDPHRLAREAGDALAVVAGLPGQVSLLVLPLAGAAAPPVIRVHADTSLAVGSVFKLWILCELLRSIEAGERRWSDVMDLDARLRGNATGMLYRWPAGTPLTLHTLASLMIALSDNSAADHLLELLGRERILATMEATGHQGVERNRPLVSTLEMAKLKGTSERPRHIDCLEWFASSSDLCRALDWFRLHTESGVDAVVARDILALNGGLELSGRTWSYVGYKGGGEAGVLSATYLLQRRRDGAWFAVAGTWNDPAGGTDTWTFFNLVRSAVHLAAESEPRGGVSR